MIIIATKDGNVWNEKNPVFKKYKDMVQIISLTGEKVTAELSSFLCPKMLRGLGMDDCAGKKSRTLAHLKSVVKELKKSLEPYEDILILSDASPETLYPFYVLKDICENQRLHLFALSLWKFEGRKKKGAHYALLEDLSTLKSIAYFDPNIYLEVPENLEKTIFEVWEMLEKEAAELLPRIIEGVQKMKSGKYYFDFASLSYVKTESNFENINLSNRKMRIGPSNAEDSDEARNDTEQLVSRVDGKNICETLKKQRKTIAMANNIPLNTLDCPSKDDCAGTCAKCDEEAAYLQKELEKIPEEKRVYPKFTIEDSK